MSEPNLDDASWLTRLREALQEPAEVPPAVVRAAYGAYTWRTIEAELAKLTYDSVADPVGVGTRSQQQAALRALTFVSSSLTIELEVDEGHLLGQLVPPQRASITVFVRSGPAQSVDVDDLGTFSIDLAPGDTFRIRILGEQTVDTDWITL